MTSITPIISTLKDLTFNKQPLFKIEYKEPLIPTVKLSTGSSPFNCLLKAHGNPLPQYLESDSETDSDPITPMAQPPVKPQQGTNAPVPILKLDKSRFIRKTKPVLQFFKPPQNLLPVPTLEEPLPLAISSERVPPITLSFKRSFKRNTKNTLNSKVKKPQIVKRKGPTKPRISKSKVSDKPQANLNPEPAAQAKSKTEKTKVKSKAKKVELTVSKTKDQLKTEEPKKHEAIEKITEAPSKKKTHRTQDKDKKAKKHKKKDKDQDKEAKKRPKKEAKERKKSSSKSDEQSTKPKKRKLVDAGVTSTDPVPKRRKVSTLAHLLRNDRQ